MQQIKWALKIFDSKVCLASCLVVQWFTCLTEHRRFNCLKLLIPLGADAHTRTHTLIDTIMKVISRNQVQPAHGWFNVFCVTTKHDITQ